MHITHATFFRASPRPNTLGPSLLSQRSSYPAPLLDGTSSRALRASRSSTRETAWCPRTPCTRYPRTRSRPSRSTLGTRQAFKKRGRKYSASGGHVTMLLRRAGFPAAFLHLRKSHGGANRGRGRLRHAPLVGRGVQGFEYGVLEMGTLLWGRGCCGKHMQRLVFMPSMYYTDARRTISDSSDM